MKKEKNTEMLPTQAEIEKFEMLLNLLDSLIKDMKEFSKKNPDGIINEYKVKKANKILRQIKKILCNQPTNEFLEVLSEEALPSYSDAVIELSQFDTAMIRFKNKYHDYDEFHKYRWFTKENPR